MPTWTAENVRPRIGQPVDDLETPALLVDVDAMERNLQEYAGVADEHDVSLRSHVKTHKNAALAKRQADLTGGGICCQTLGEVETMAKNGIDDIYLSYQVVGERKCDRLAWLAEQVDRLATTVDSETNVDELETAAAKRDVELEVIVEVDVGVGRTGVEPGDEAVELAEYVTAQEHLDFRGLLAYEAHVKGEAETEAEFEDQTWQAMDLAQSVVEGIEAAGIDVPEVKVGGTATARYSARHPVVTEINPGMYPFNDVGELECRPWALSKDDCAATVLTTVISVPSEDRVIVDGGSKTFSLDKPQMPVPKHRDDVAYYNASEEHGWIDVSESDEQFEVGDRLEFIVPHVCTTVNLHDLILGVRDGRLADRWEVQARGKVK